MDAQDVLLGHAASMRWEDPDPAVHNCVRVATEVRAALAAQRERFAPGSPHPVAMMLDEWLARLDAYVAGPPSPVPD